MSDKYYPTIGLEIHAELKTQTKMFCDSKNDTAEKRPNVNICPVCMGHPGTLPVVNREAVRSVLKVGVAVCGKIADYTEFDRKNYFYPDIPKGYQISQYKFPLVSGGELAGVKLTRIHLEEDTAKSTHEEGMTNSSADDFSLVDFNRAGVPLMELVTEPVITNAEQVVKFAKELQLILRYLGISDANMEKGEMRVEANISISPDKNKLGKKVEVKNLNSFRSVERAIVYELERHKSVLDDGGEVVQETRGWDEEKNKTFSQRQKEDSHDYRYFPEPDIPKIKISEVADFSYDVLKKELLELPSEKRERYLKFFGLKPEDVEIFVQEVELSKFFDEVALALKNDLPLVKLASNYVVSDVLGMLKENNFDLKIKSDAFASLVLMIGKGELSSRGAKDILRELFDKGGDPKVIARDRGLFQKNDESEIKDLVRKVIKNNSQVVEEYRSGKVSSIQYLIGRCMKESQGSANPKMLADVLKLELK